MRDTWRKGGDEGASQSKKANLQKQMKANKSKIKQKKQS